MEQKHRRAQLRRQILKDHRMRLVNIDIGTKDVTRTRPQTLLIAPELVTLLLIVLQILHHLPLSPQTEEPLQRSRLGAPQLPQQRIRRSPHAPATPLTILKDQTLPPPATLGRSVAQQHLQLIDRVEPLLTIRTDTEVGQLLRPVHRTLRDVHDTIGHHRTGMNRVECGISNLGHNPMLRMLDNKTRKGRCRILGCAQPLQARLQPIPILQRCLGQALVKQLCKGLLGIELIITANPSARGDVKGTLGHPRIHHESVHKILYGTQVDLGRCTLGGTKGGHAQWTICDRVPDHGPVHSHIYLGANLLLVAQDRHILLDHPEPKLPLNMRLQLRPGGIRLSELCESINGK